MSVTYTIEIPTKPENTTYNKLKSVLLKNFTVIVLNLFYASKFNFVG